MHRGFIFTKTIRYNCFYTDRFTRPHGRRVPFVRRLGENRLAQCRVFRKPFTRSAAVFPFGLSFLRHGPSTTRPPSSNSRLAAAWGGETKIVLIDYTSMLSYGRTKVLLAKFAGNFFFFYSFSFFFET